MLNSVEVRNFGPLREVKWAILGRINLVIGSNGSGKTFFLKGLYSAMRTLEEYKRGNDGRTVPEILADKLRWTFQVERIGDLVTRGADARLRFELFLNEKQFSFSFGKESTKRISTIENYVPPPRNDNSIFLPAKEVLSVHGIILKSRDQDRLFGFDDTYLDLARALRIPTTQGRNYPAFAKSRERLRGMIGGFVRYDEEANQWYFRSSSGHVFNMGVTAEGTKKIAILDTLLGNRHLSPGSFVFIDEPEAAMHPAMISELLDIVTNLAEAGIQFFMATHSYFVINKLFLIAQKRKWSIPVLSSQFSTGDGSLADAWRCDDLLDGMPDNPIIDESIRMYENEWDVR
ncbi:MAG: AAA family ATPase [Magnetococcales bacterium]|nr:AAA family ATPase [Magnetococcales bacterium]